MENTACQSHTNYMATKSHMSITLTNRKYMSITCQLHGNRKHIIPKSLTKTTQIAVNLYTNTLMQKLNIPITHHLYINTLTWQNSTCQLHTSKHSKGKRQHANYIPTACQGKTQHSNYMLTL